ncbi:MAG: hypothetical protein A2Y97_13935 [Nitrospirae bacterium RBG_13_39_12]|nr:MAG: hypothetical protein A2Y97_13935 [Nitrospirae bacterium RBG_13_39_12]
MKKKRVQTFSAVISVYPVREQDYIDKGIKLKVKAAPDDWRRLAEFIKKNPDGFHHDFSREIINILSDLPPPLYKKNSFEAGFYSTCGNDKKPRGKHKKTGWLEKTIKSGAGQLYSLFSYYYKNPNEQPEFFKKLKDIAEKNGYFPKACNDKILLTGLVIYCIEKRYDADLRSWGMKKIDKDKHESFYNIYIVNNDYIKFYKEYSVINDADAILKEHAPFLIRASFWQNQKITP